MRFAFIARHRGIWPVAWLCDALDVSRSGFHAWLNRGPSARSRHDEILVSRNDRSFKSSDRTYGARCVWHDVLAEGLSCGLRRVERLMRESGLRARPRRRGLPKDTGERASVSDLTAPLRHRRRTRSGSPTSLTSGQPKVGSTLPPSSTCSPAVSLVGR
jgi:putative transposase